MKSVRATVPLKEYITVLIYYRRQDSDFTCDRYGHSSDQLSKDLQIGVIYSNTCWSSALWNQFYFNYKHCKCFCLTSLDGSLDSVSVLTASILSGSARRAAPIPPCKRWENRSLRLWKWGGVIEPRLTLANIMSTPTFLEQSCYSSQHQLNTSLYCNE